MKGLGLVNSPGREPAPAAPPPRPIAPAAPGPSPTLSYSARPLADPAQLAFLTPAQSLAPGEIAGVEGGLGADPFAPALAAPGSGLAPAGPSMVGECFFSCAGSCHALPFLFCSYLDWRFGGCFLFSVRKA